MQHPGLRFVDFLSFSGRARGLSSGTGVWVHPLYPVGYPVLLWLGHAVTGDVLWVGRVLSIVGAVCAVRWVSRWLTPWVGLWLLAQPALLQWGATEGTDTLAAALGMGAIALARRNPLYAGVLLGLGCLVRYTAITALPAVWLLSARPRDSLLGLGVATLPHWGVALWTGASVLPNQSSNVAIGGHHTVWSLSLAQELPRRMWMALGAAVHDPVAKAGLLGLVVGVLRRDRRAWGLTLAAGTHLLAVSLAFSNDRLVLPATLMIACGACWLLVRWWMMLPALIAALTFSLPRALTHTPVEDALQGVVAVTQDLDGPFLTTSPWFYHEEDGWLVSGILVRRIPGEPHRLTPTEVRDWALTAGVSHMVVDAGRVRHSFPGLGVLLSRTPPDGFRKVDQAGGWLVLSISPD